MSESDVSCPSEWSQQEQDRFWMQKAVELAKRSEAEGEVPVGAVVVLENRLIAEGWNRPIQDHDPSAHAEMVALREAGKVLQNYRLPETTLYVTLEPCPMCAGAMVHARVRRLVYAAPDPRTGAAGSVFNLAADERLNHRIEVISGVMEAECSEMLRAFFRRRRARAKSTEADKASLTP